MYGAPGLTVYHILSIGKQPDSSRIQILIKLLDPIFDLYISISLSLSLSLLTSPPFPPSMPDIMWWYYLPRAQDKATLGTSPMGLDATLDHYVSHPITFDPPSHPVLLSPSMSPSPHRLRRSPTLLKKSCPAPPNTLFAKISYLFLIY